MQLRFLSTNTDTSIKEFDTVENMPNFVILTGLNGSGKTHLLTSIKSGWSMIDDVIPTNISYYSYLNFRVTNSASVNESQLKAQQAEAWQFFKGGNKQHRLNLVATTTPLYNRTFIEQIPQSEEDTASTVDHYVNKIQEKHGLWDDLPVDLDITTQERITQYRILVDSQIFRNAVYQQYPRSQTVTKTLKKIGKPIHTISEDEFNSQYMPSSEGDNYLATAIGNIFTIYKIRQYRHFHDEWERSGYKATGEELAETFSGRLEKPWDVMNELLDTVHRHADNKDVFNFAITDPGDEILQTAHVPSYTFSPELIDRSVGEPRSFGLLSSGEQVLLALAITIFESQRGFEFPKVILLDEIDATLHPSMIRALLRTIRDVFVSRGVKVLLSTHAPTTVALSDEGEVYVVNPGTVRNKIEAIPRAQAMSLITEGYVTLDTGVSIFDEISKHGLCIITEGNNTKIIERALEFLGETKVQVVTGAEGRSGKTQLKVLYEFFTRVSHQTKVLFILDVDVQEAWEAETETTFDLRLPFNSENTLVVSGIENMFPTDLVSPFVDQIVRKQGDTETVIKTEFSKAKKTEFANLVVSRGTANDFANFSCIKTKLDAIRTAS